MTQPVNILLVDDENTGREVLSLALQERGFHTFQAEDGQKALEALEGGQFDVVISDVLMPRMDGYRLCYEVRKVERWRSLPFIIYTGTYTTIEDERLGMEFGADKYLRKTGSVDEIVLAVEEALNASRKKPLPKKLDELDVMKVYSERLVKKLEEKNLELENAQKDLLHTNRELTKLTEELRNSEARLIETQEVERKRISRELHDSVGQMLSSVKFRIQSAGEKIHSQKSKVWKDLSGAWTLLEQSIHEIRRIAYNLRPSVLDDLGLVSAVRSMCEEFEERTSITVNLRSSRFPTRLPSEVELALFRIIQEVLNNVEQHSKATKLGLQIQKTNSHLLVKIKDNGKGFDPLTVQKLRSRARGYGLDGIRERVATIGGRLELLTEANKGVEIQIRVHLEGQAPP
ncbi:MAG: Response regulator [Bacteroidetes bacterium]|nr:Response regulator [Bacteroidota bacterium]